MLPEASTGPMPAPAGLLRVLYVEDCPADAELAVRELRGAGFQVAADVVDTPDDFFQRLTSTAYDLVITDYGLPGWSGNEVLSMVRSQPREVPVVVVTGALGEEMAVDFIQRGAADYVLKERLARLPLAVHRALGEKQLREERKQAEGTLRASEREYRHLFEAANDPILIFDAATGTILEANARACETYGFSHTELLGMSLKQLTLDVPLGEKQIGELLREGSCRNLESVHLRRNGTPIHLLASSSVIEYRGRKAILTINRDITERKQAEEKLRLQATVLESAANSIMITDHDGQILWVNPAFTRLTGYAAEEAIGQTPRLLSSGKQERSFYQHLWDTILSGQVWRGETVNRRKDGSLYSEEQTITPMRNAAGKITHFIGIKQDVTERKQAEEKLKLYRRIFASATDAISIVDPQGHYLEQNAAYEELSGYCGDELRRHPPALVLGEETCQRIDQELAIWGRYSGEAVMRTKGGQEVVIDLSAFTMLGDAGQVLCQVGTARDVTERKRLEEQLRQAQKMEAVGRLAGGVAHDFNNLLNIIIGYSELLLDRAGLDETLGKSLKEIRKAGERAATLTRQLLAFSRKQVLEPRILDLNAVTAEMDAMLQRMIGEDVELVTLPSEELWKVRADRGQIEQVMMNLAANARDAMPKGGKLTIETANIHLDREYAAQHDADVPAGSYVMLAVSDTGHGMDAETCSHVFEPFFSTKEKGKGTGLGLAMVYGIVKQSGGYIWLYSEPGHGTTFKIYLPQVEAVEEPQAAVHLIASRGGAETILVVEDQDGVRELVRDSLTRDGYTVLVASSGDEALRLARAHRGEIHLMISDVVMPGMSGCDLAGHMAALRPAMKVLYVSGYTETAVHRSGVLQPGTSFLQKPFRPADLGRKVREILDAREPLAAQAI